MNCNGRECTSESRKLELDLLNHCGKNWSYLAFRKIYVNNLK
jgi:hypothetical protein